MPTTKVPQETPAFPDIIRLIIDSLNYFLLTNKVSFDIFMFLFLYSNGNFLGPLFLLNLFGYDFTIGF